MRSRERKDRKRERIKLAGSRVLEDRATGRKIRISHKARAILPGEREADFTTRLMEFLNQAKIAIAFVGKSWDGLTVELHGFGEDPREWSGRGE